LDQHLIHTAVVPNFLAKQLPPTHQQASIFAFFPIHILFYSLCLQPHQSLHVTLASAPSSHSPTCFSLTDTTTQLSLLVNMREVSRVAGSAQSRGRAGFAGSFNGTLGRASVHLPQACRRDQTVSLLAVWPAGPLLCPLLLLFFIKADDPLSSLSLFDLLETLRFL
jgi:hypothetical protein